MEELLGALLYGVLEGALSGIAEAMLNAMVHSTKRRDAVNVWLAVGGYFLVGGVAGGLSLLAIDTPILRTPLTQGLGLIGAIMAAGLTASAFGAWRRRRGRPVLRVDRFGFGAAFGFGFGLLRMLAT